MNLNLSDDALKDVVQKAIFEAISAEQRETLLKEAIKHLTTAPPSGGGYGYGPRLTPLQEAFNRSIEKLAREMVETRLSTDDAFRATVTGVIEDALRIFMEKDKAKVAEEMAGAIAKAFTRERQ